MESALFRTSSWDTVRLRKLGQRVFMGGFVLFMVAVLVFNGAAVFNITRDRIDHTAKQGAPEDYMAYYAAAKLVRDGRGDEIYDIHAVERGQIEALGRPAGYTGILPYFNPPFFVALIAPLTALGVTGFSIAYMAIIAAMCVLGAYMMQRFVGLPKKWQTAMFWLGFMTSLSVTWVIVEGQVSTFVFFGLLGFVWLEMRGEHRWSGAALALTLVKPQMAIVILALLLWKHRWQTLVAFSAAAVPLVAISIAVSGPNVLLDYPRYLVEASSWGTYGISAKGMFSWNGLVGNVLNDKAPPQYALIPFTIVTLAAIAWAWKDEAWRPREDRFLLLIGATMLALLATNPHLYLQDVLLIAVPVACGARYALTTTGRLGAWAAIALTLYATQMYISSVSGLVSTSAPMMVGLMGYMIYEARRTRVMTTTQQDSMFDEAPVALPRAA